jgi:hypothetical protein
MLLKLFHETEREGTLLSSIYKAKITLIPKLKMDTTKRKLYINFFDEHTHENFQ